MRDRSWVYFAANLGIWEDADILFLSLLALLHFWNNNNKVSKVSMQLLCDFFLLSVAHFLLIFLMCTNVYKFWIIFYWKKLRTAVLTNINKDELIP